MVQDGTVRVQQIGYATLSRLYHLVVEAKSRLSMGKATNSQRPACPGCALGTGARITRRGSWPGGVTSLSSKVPAFWASVNSCWIAGRLRHVSEPAGA